MRVWVCYYISKKAFPAFVCNIFTTKWHLHWEWSQPASHMKEATPKSYTKEGIEHQNEEQKNSNIDKVSYWLDESSRNLAKTF